MFGLFQQVSVWGAIAAIPVTAWEMSLAVYMIVKGFKPAPILGNTDMSERRSVRQLA